MPLILGVVLLALPAAAQTAPSIGSARPRPRGLPDRPNLLLVIADDVGVDRVGAYAEHPEPGHTPVIDRLAREGVLFRNAWSNPTCSPTRATLLTGRYSFRTGVGRSITYAGSAFELSTESPSLPIRLKPQYRAAAVGKWHLSSAAGSGLAHPLLLGFDHHRGPIDNLSGGEASYDRFAKAVDGVEVLSTTYATTDQVDDALELIDALPEPWFLWLAFSASHGPFHKPPDALHGFDLPPEVSDDIPLHMQAMTEALDTELGRLLGGLSPAVAGRTVILFVGDNGTDQVATTPPFPPEHGKATLFEGGVNVPLIISGPGLARGAECAALVNTTDLYATALELAGTASVGGAAAAGGEDALSLVPYLVEPDLPSQRAWVYAESFAPNGAGPWATRRRAVREARFKLVWFDPGSGPPTEQFLYDLQVDPIEQVDLLAAGPLSPEALGAYEALAAVLLELER
jgi:arylsulfatase A-like enzyme